MSTIVTTPIGRFKLVNPGGMSYADSWTFECPGCGQWAYLDGVQWAGGISVDHTSASCNYHETHNFREAFETAFPERETAR